MTTTSLESTCFFVPFRKPPLNSTSIEFFFRVVFLCSASFAFKYLSLTVLNNDQNLFLGILPVGIVAAVPHQCLCVFTLVATIKTKTFLPCRNVVDHSINNIKAIHFSRLKLLYHITHSHIDLIICSLQLLSSRFKHKTAPSLPFVVSFFSLISLFMQTKHESDSE